MRVYTADDVRRIVREELARAFPGGPGAPSPIPASSPRRPPSQGGIHGDAVRRFVATLEPDAVEGALTLWHRYRAWAAREAPDAARLSETLFGRLLGEDERMVKGRDAARRICYRRQREG